MLMKTRLLVLSHRHLPLSSRLIVNGTEAA